MWEHMKQWFNNLLGPKPTVKNCNRKTRKFLTKKEVQSIENLLDEGKYTQKEIAQYFEVSRSVVSKIKLGKHKYSFVNYVDVQKSDLVKDK